MARERFDCRCGWPAHALSVWFDDDLLTGLPAAERDFELSIGTPAQTWLRGRIAEAWRVLRGRRAIYGDVLLDVDDARRLRDLLDGYIAAVEGGAR